MLMRPARQAGASLIEVLVAILIVSFGLMALAGMQATMGAAVLESYQRTHAVTLLQDMAQRMEANQSQADNYVTTGTVGADGTPLATCALDALPVSPDTRRQRDLCEWSNLLKGASEKTAANASVGNLVAGRGCIERLRAPDPASGVCQPGVYRITVAWQGQAKTVAPEVSCGSGLYASEETRKTVSSQVLVAMPGCS